MRKESDERHAEPHCAVLFICLGNICRSPAAEGVLKSMLRTRGLSAHVEVDSAGIGSWHVGELPDARMRKHAAMRGYKLDSRARQFQAADFKRFDYIVVMDDDNYGALMARAASDEERRKVLRMRDYFQKNAGQNNVPDPYYGDGSDFEWALDLIEDGCEGLIQALWADA